MSREALVLLVCCCDFRDGAERLIPSKSLRNAVIRAFPGLLCILRMCAPRRAVAVVRPRGREKSADRRRRILISRLLIIRASVPRRKSPFPAYFRGFPAVSPLIPPYPAFLKYPVSPHSACLNGRLTCFPSSRIRPEPRSSAVIFCIRLSPFFFKSWMLASALSKKERRIDYSIMAVFDRSKRLIRVESIQLLCIMPQSDRYAGTHRSLWVVWRRGMLTARRPLLPQRSAARRIQ